MSTLDFSVAAQPSFGLAAITHIFRQSKNAINLSLIAHDGKL